MPKICSVCAHAQRAEIENALLSVMPESKITVESIAEQFGVTVDDLKMHAMFHAPLLVEFDEATHSEAPESLARRLKLREADMLKAASDEYLVTLKSMGRRLNSLINPLDPDLTDSDKLLRLSKMLTKPMVDLYLGLGGEIRQNAKTAAELDRMLNGPEDSTSSGLIALASAIQGSGTR